MSMTTSIRAPVVSLIHRVTSITAPPQFSVIQKNSTSRTATSGVIYSNSHMKNPCRFLHATSSMKAYHDSSTIDCAYMPQEKLEELSYPEIMRIPLLPNNYSPHRDHREAQDTIMPVTRPEISTASADGTHIDSPSAMSEVTDNHAIELDPYDLASKVTAAAANTAVMPERKLEEPGMIQNLWASILDDLLGSKKLAKT